MIPWLLWFFLSLHLFLLDGFLAARLPACPDLALCVALFCALHARTQLLAGVLFCAALSRSVLMEGGLCAHLLLLGIPVAVLLPLRGLFAAHSLLWPSVAAGFLAFALPRLAGLLHRITDEVLTTAPPTGLQILLSMVLVPLVTALLRRLPPLRMFEEEGA